MSPLYVISLQFAYLNDSKTHLPKQVLFPFPVICPLVNLLGLSSKYVPFDSIDL